MGGVFNVVNLHTYHYAGNNPVKYVDPDGSIINIPDAKDKKDIVKMINSVSKYKYTTDFQGNLMRDGNRRNLYIPLFNKRSQSFSDQLDKGINENIRTLTIRISDWVEDDRRNKVNVDEIFGGGVTGETKYHGGLLSYTTTVTGRESSRGIPLRRGGTEIDSAAKTLVHELTVHGIPLITNKRETLNNENSVRQEMGWHERGFDVYHKY
jgi:hypothetical protein